MVFLKFQSSDHQWGNTIRYMEICLFKKAFNLFNSVNVIYIFGMLDRRQWERQWWNRYWAFLSKHKHFSDFYLRLFWFWNLILKSKGGETIHRSSHLCDWDCYPKLRYTYCPISQEVKAIRQLNLVS